MKRNSLPILFHGSHTVNQWKFSYGHFREYEKDTHTHVLHKLYYIPKNLESSHLSIWIIVAKLPLKKVVYLSTYEPLFLHALPNVECYQIFLILLIWKVKKITIFAFVDYLIMVENEHYFMFFATYISFSIKHLHFCIFSYYITFYTAICVNHV